MAKISVEGESVSFLELHPKVRFSRHRRLTEAQGVMIIERYFQEDFVAQPFLNLCWEIKALETTGSQTEACPFPHLSAGLNTCLFVVLLATTLRGLKLP